MFKQVHVIPSQVSIDTNYYAVKLTSIAASLTTYNNTTTGGSVLLLMLQKRQAYRRTDPDTLFVKYNKTGTNKTSVVFTDAKL